MSKVKKDGKDLVLIMHKKKIKQLFTYLVWHCKVKIFLNMYILSYFAYLCLCLNFAQSISSFSHILEM